MSSPAHQDQIEVFGFERRQRFAAVGGNGDAMPVFLQQGDRQFLVDDAVLGHEQVRGDAQLLAAGAVRFYAACPFLFLFSFEIESGPPVLWQAGGKDDKDDSPPALTATPDALGPQSPSVTPK